MPKFKKSEVVTRNDGASITITHGETYPTTFGPITVNLHPKVIIQVGPTIVRKKVLRSDLCRASPQWAMALRNMFPQRFAGIVSLPHVDVETFRHFRRWLKDRSYHPDTWDAALKLLAFADVPTVYDLRNDLVGAFFRFYVDPAHINFVPPHAFVDAIYTMPNHPLSGVGKLKDLVSELYVRRRSRQELRDNEYSSLTLDTGFKTQLLWKSPNTTGWYTEHWGPRRDPAWLRCPMVLEDYLVNDELTAAWYEKDPETGPRSATSTTKRDAKSAFMCTLRTDSLRATIWRGVKSLSTQGHPDQGKDDLPGASCLEPRILEGWAL